MKILHNNQGEKGAFKVYFDSELAGEITYVKAGADTLILDHTSVSDNYRGKGVGNNIMQEIITYVRENKLNIIPLCPFVKSVFAKDASIADVLKK